MELLGCSRISMARPSSIVQRVIALNDSETNHRENQHNRSGQLPRQRCKANSSYTTFYSLGAPCQRFPSITSDHHICNRATQARLCQLRQNTVDPVVALLYRLPSYPERIFCGEQVKCMPALVRDDQFHGDVMLAQLVPGSNAHGRWKPVVAGSMNHECRHLVRVVPHVRQWTHFTHFRRARARQVPPMLVVRVFHVIAVCELSLAGKPAEECPHRLSLPIQMQHDSGTRILQCQRK